MKLTTLMTTGILLATLPVFAAPSAKENLDALRVGQFAIAPEKTGVHPRLFTTPGKMAATQKQHRENPALFAKFLPEPPFESVPSFNTATTDQRQWRVFRLVHLAVAWRVTGDAAIREHLLRDWTPVMEEYQPIVTKNLGGGEGLASGHILLGLAIVHDTLQGAFDPGFEKTIRAALIAQTKQTYDDLVWRKNFSYEQNHLIIPVCGLATATLALADDPQFVPEWGVFAQNLAARCLAAIAHDGWFFEGVSYWGYTMQFPSTYALALKGTTGRDLFAEPPFRDAGLFLAHMFLPHPRFVFDFGDWGPRVNGDGVTAQKGYELPWHTLTSGVKHFPAMAILQSTQDPLLAAFIARQKKARADINIPIDSAFSLLWQEKPFPDDAEQGYATRPPYHYFHDMDIIHWRNDWFDPDATALAFKSGPPAGHRVGELLPGHPEWKPSLGHAHPDAGSFILFAKGVFLANDTGYTGKKETADHNSILIDGVGQARGGTAWGTFPIERYPKYNKIHLRDTWLTPRVAAATAVFADAYDVPDFAMERVNRHLMLIQGRFLVILDDLRSAKPHTYQFRLHGDREPVALDEHRVLFRNGPAQLVLHSLGTVARRSIAPTLVETELYPQKPSRPQRRGFHVALDSPKVENHFFVTAACIQAGDESPDAFTAVLEAPGRLRLSDGKQTCVVWLGDSAGLEGSFAYALLDSDGAPSMVGLNGKTLSTDFLSLQLETPGAAEFIRSPSGSWQPASKEQTAGVVRTQK
ncbi:Heparinase II/III-like protein [Opitutaceae bacterium TAV1]|nr:Heparinase II/III-like protein [Opitutaceae bacterium TAV1]